MSIVRYARVKSSIEENNDDIANQLQTIGSEDEEEDILVPAKMSRVKDHVKIKHSYHRKAEILAIALLILCYFILSIGLTFYQRWLLKGFKFPFSVVIYHLFIKLVLSALIRFFYRIITGRDRIKIPISVAVKKVAPTSFFGAVDIGFSQWGLEFVDVALYTMTKSTVIIFISFFAVLFRLEKKSWSLLIIVLMISSGLFLFTYKSTEFSLLGFALLLIASFSSGARWTLAQILMQKSKLGLHNPIDMIFFMQPYMLISLLPFALVFESEKLFSHFNQFLELDYYEVFVLWIKISIGAFLAFFMEISEFLVLSQTSSLTLSVSGIFKEICQLVLAVEINGDILSVYNIVGLMLCLGGIASHVINKYWLYSDNEKEAVVEPEGVYDMNSPYSGKIISNGETVPTNGTTVVIKYNAGLKEPLLNYDSDTDDKDDDNEIDNQSAEILFDILKRRDGTRN